ncbi:retropepsin-like aspartic protease [Sphingomonas sp. I4]
MRAVVDTRINGRPSPFILDSGAFFSNIWPAVARELDLPRKPLPEGCGWAGSGRDRWHPRHGPALHAGRAGCAQCRVHRIGQRPGPERADRPERPGAGRCRI